MFWSEEGQSRTDARFRRSGQRERRRVWVSLKLPRVITLVTVVAAIVAAAGYAPGHPFGGGSLGYEIVAISLGVVGLVLIPSATDSSCVVDLPRVGDR
jgi:hypothetical protein